MKNFGWKMEARRILIEKVFSTWLPVGANVHRWFWLEYRWFWNHWEASARVPDGLQFSVPKKCTLVGNYEHWDWTKSPEKQRVITDGLGLPSQVLDHKMVLLQGTLWDTKIINEVYQTPSKPPFYVFCGFLISGLVKLGYTAKASIKFLLWCKMQWDIPPILVWA